MLGLTAEDGLEARGVDVFDFSSVDRAKIHFSKQKPLDLLIMDAAFEGSFRAKELLEAAIQSGASFDLIVVTGLQTSASVPLTSLIASAGRKLPKLESLNYSPEFPPQLSLLELTRLCNKISPCQSH